MLSDLTGVLLAGHRRRVVLAGDLNISTQWSRPSSTKANMTAAFARIRALNLVDCVAHTRACRPRLVDCAWLLSDHSPIVVELNDDVLSAH